MKNNDGVDDNNNYCAIYHVADDDIILHFIILQGVNGIVYYTHVYRD